MDPNDLPSKPRDLVSPSKAVSGGWRAPKRDGSRSALPSLQKSRSESQLEVLEPDFDVVDMDIKWSESVPQAQEQLGRRSGSSFSSSSLCLRGIDASQKPALVSCLRDGSAFIRVLYLENCSLFSQGSNDAFVRVLASMSALEILSIRHCEMFDKLCASVLAALRTLECLRRLVLVRVGCTKAISDDIRQLCQANTSLEHLIIREELVTEQYFSWVVASAVSETRTSVTFYLAQNKALRQLASNSTLGCSVALCRRRLETVPLSVFAEPANLSVLDLSCNSLVGLPDNIGDLINLVSLDLSCNQLSVLPTGMGQLTKLESLNVSHNELVELSESIGFLLQLRMLDVSSNRLRDLPQSLACLPHLHEVNFQDPTNPTNKFPFPQEVQEGGSLSILTFIKHNLKRHRLFNVVPVFFTGPRGSGKTRLIQLLSSSDPRPQSTTPTSALTGRPKKGSSDSSSLIGKVRSTRSATSEAGSSGDSTETDEGGSVEITPIRFQSFRTNLMASGGSISLSKDKDKEKDGDVMVDVWDFSGMDLVPLFQKEATIVVVTVNVSSDRFSSSMVVKMIQGVTRFPSTRVLLVGTFSDMIQQPAKLAVVEAELDRVVSAFPEGVVERILVSLKGDGKTSRKQIRDTFCRIISESPLIKQEIPSSWLLFATMLETLGICRSLPVIGWEELQHVATTCTIPESSLVRACQFLENVGKITFSEAPGSDWCMLSPSWIVTMWAPIRLLQAHNGIRGIVSADELVLAWQACKCPTWATRPLVSLLKRLKMVIPVPKQRLLVVPSHLPKPRPFDLEHVWPNHCPAEQMQYSRIYTLSEPLHDQEVFAQLLVHLMKLDWVPLSVWRSGLVMSNREEVMLVEASTSSLVVKLHVRAPGVSTHLISIIFAVATLLSDASSAGFNMEVLCLHCLRERSYDPFVFTKAELEDAVAGGKAAVFCRSVNPILIHSMAPDISMAGMAVHTVQYNDLNALTLVGEGGFARVYQAYWRDSLVAVKKLQPLQGADDTAEERRSLFAEFRREAWLMSGLEHPNLVNLKGICLEPFCIIMEYMNAGTLYTLLHNEQIQGTFPIALAVKLALDIAKGMEFLHGITPPIVHRDLKTPNILLHAASDCKFTQINLLGSSSQTLAALPRDPSGLVAKVADFGLSLETELAALQCKNNSVVDNPTWTAPEVLSHAKYTHKVDVYSFGVILWELLTRKHFFGEIKFMAQLEQEVKAGKRPAIPSQCPIPYQRLIEACWAQDPQKRPDFVDCRTALQKMAAEIGIDSSQLRTSSAKSMDRLSTRIDRGPSGGSIIIAGEQQIFDEMEAGQVLLPQHESSVTALAVVGNTFWTGSSRGEIFVWDLMTHVLLHQYQPDGSKAQAAAAMDTESLPRESLRKPSVTCIASLGHSVWTGFSDGNIIVWSHDLQILKQLRKHPESIMFFGAEGVETVLSACMSGHVRRWNVQTWKFSTIEVGFPITCMTQLGVSYVFGSGSNVMMLFPDKTTYVSPVAHQGVVHSVIVVRDMVWTSSSDKTIRVWKLGADARSLDAIKVLNGHSSRVFCLVTDKSCDLVYSGSWDRDIMVWDVEKLQFVGRLNQCHTDAVSTVGYAACEGIDYLISGSMDKNVVMYRKKKKGSSNSLEEELVIHRPSRRLADLSAMPATTDNLHMELLTPAERQVLLAMQKDKQPPASPLKLNLRQNISRKSTSFASFVGLVSPRGSAASDLDLSGSSNNNNNVQANSSPNSPRGYSSSPSVTVGASPSKTSPNVTPTKKQQSLLSRMKMDQRGRSSSIDARPPGAPMAVGSFSPPPDADSPPGLPAVSVAGPDRNNSSSPTKSGGSGRQRSHTIDLSTVSDEHAKSKATMAGSSDARAPTPLAKLKGLFRRSSTGIKSSSMSNLMMASGGSTPTTQPSSPATVHTTTDEKPAPGSGGRGSEAEEDDSDDRILFQIDE